MTLDRRALGFRQATAGEILQDEIKRVTALQAEINQITPKRTLHVPKREPDPDQLALDDLAPDPEQTLQERFEEFHRANPHIYGELVKLARRFKGAGNPRGSISMMFEVLRYRRGLMTRGDEFKLNNNYRSRYSRLISEQEEDLSDFFETRQLHTR